MNTLPLLVRIGREYSFDEVLVLCLVRGDTHASSVLRFVFRNGHAFDVSAVRHGDNHVLFFDKVFDVDIAVIVGEFAHSGRVVLRLDVGHFLDDDVLDFLVA